MTKLAALAVLMAITGVLGKSAVAQTDNAQVQMAHVNHLSHAQLKYMIHNAHAASQYQALASYFRSRQQTLEQAAQSEKSEWERRSRNIIGPATKYPRPVDSSRYRYEYFMYEAQQMDRRAEHYESLGQLLIQPSGR